MKKSGYSDTKETYNRFEKAVKMHTFSTAVFTILFCIGICAAKRDVYKLLFGFFLLLDTVFCICSSMFIVKKGDSYLQLLAEERNTIELTGIFKAIYEAYWHDGFEFNLIYDKLVHEEYDHNAIQIILQKNQRECIVEIDAHSIIMTIDEETDAPIEEEIPLTGVFTMDQVYSAINEFINLHTTYL